MIGRAGGGRGASLAARGGEANLFDLPPEGRCSRCGRRLTGARSVARGMGHACFVRSIQPDLPGLEARRG